MSKRSSAETVKIHLVMGRVNHSGSDVLRAFADPNDAARFQKQLQDLEQKRPRFHDDGADDWYERCQKKHQRWCAAHPLRERLGSDRKSWYVMCYDTIEVLTIDLHV
jgi:predicted DNA-binding WGR domain protein